MNDRDSAYDAAFDAYMAAVDLCIEAKAGLYAADLPDFDYPSAFRSGVSARETAAEALAEAGWEGDDDDDA